MSVNPQGFLIRCRYNELTQAPKTIHPLIATRILLIAG